MRTLISIIFLTGIVYSGCSQSIVKSRTEIIEIDTSKYIVDPIEKVPFVIERENIYSIIPDSLAKNLSGIAVLKLYINNKGIIENFELVKLSLKKDNARFIEYQRKKLGSFNIKTYPDNIQKYYLFLLDYVNMLKIRQVTSVAPRSTTIIHLLVRFK